MPTCLHCHHLRVKIPVRTHHSAKNPTIFNQRILYGQGMVWCEEGEITTNKDETRYFYHVMENKKFRNLKAFERASNCPWYEEDV